ncbi:DUF488 domain-containing protein [Tahibacter amnicola]|uniref:DUF488 family protein n=1 Tax=Tahibacter amnicola TaxID=2976241 RepID=A0ABY6BFL6_9GAMM|nr:DUF488 family protein [Tahibacter amnicola]UXI68053.1 DUF488 family protein [Tahibacter amnicola]
MAIRIVQLGSPRAPGENLRLGTVRRPPRGVPRSEFARRDFYDVWLPALSPSPALVSEGRAATDAAGWNRFARQFRREMKQPEAQQWLSVLAAFSHTTHFSIGCYCEEESHCHRSLLRELLAQHGATIVPLEA